VEVSNKAKDIKLVIEIWLPRETATFKYPPLSLSLGCSRVIDGEKSKLVSGSKAESVGSTHFSMRAETWEIYSKRFAVVKHNRKFHPSPLMSVPKGGGSHAPFAKKLLWLWIKFAHIFLSRICLRLGYCFFYENLGAAK
jgi:hypothetical protein